MDLTIVAAKEIHQMFEHFRKKITDNVSERRLLDHSLFTAININLIVSPVDEIFLTALLKYRFPDGEVFKLSIFPESVILSASLKNIILFLIKNSIFETKIPEVTFLGQMQSRIQEFTFTLAQKFFEDFPEFHTFLPEKISKTFDPCIKPERNSVIVSVNDDTIPSYLMEISTTFPCSIHDFSSRERVIEVEDLLYTPPIHRIYNSNLCMEIYENIPLPENFGEEDFLGYKINFYSNETICPDSNNFPHFHSLRFSGKCTLQSLQDLTKKYHVNMPKQEENKPCAISVFFQTKKHLEDFCFLVANS